MSILRDALERHRRRASTTGAGGLPEGIVKETVDASDARVERSRVSVGGYVHVSTLVAGFCTRMRVISVRHEVPVVRRVTGSHRVVWKRGLTAEEHLRSGFIKVRRSSVFGEWTCVCGHTRHRGHYPSNREGCERCRQRPRHYKGLTLFSPHHGVVGNADMVFDWEGHYVPVEIKSLDNRQQWERMDAPVGIMSFRCFSTRSCCG